MPLVTSLLSPPPQPLISTSKLRPITKLAARSLGFATTRKNTFRISGQQRFSVGNLHSDMAAPSSVGSPAKWAQKTVTIPAQKRGCHLITSMVIVKEIGNELSGFKCGLAHLFLQHTSASLTINENYDSDVRYDTETFLNRIVPEGASAPWMHTLEVLVKNEVILGPDDMPAHIKSSMFGCTLTIPVTNGKLNMGTWQGIWLCEHRDAATPRRIVVTINGI